MAATREKATEEPSFLIATDMRRMSYKQLRELMKDEPYEMQLNRSDAKEVIAAINQGIDSHLEACFVPARGDSHSWEGNKMHCVFSVESFPTLLRRLYESDREESLSLADSMLYVLEHPDS